MLMDIIMESLAAMDEETLNVVLESMDDEEIGLVNGYLDELDTEEEDADMPEDNIEDVVESLMSLDEGELDQVIESLTTEEFEYLKAACEKVIDFNKKVYYTRKNPAKFIITPEILNDAGIPKERADELFDALCDYMAEKKYISCGRKELPEKIAAYFKKTRKITPDEITEFGWRYFKKVKAMLLKAAKSGDVDDKAIIQNANQKALKSANIEIAAKSALTLIINSAVSLGTGLAFTSGMTPRVGKDTATLYGRLTAGSGVLGSGIGSFIDYAQSKHQLDQIASRS